MGARPHLMRRAPLLLDVLLIILLTAVLIQPLFRAKYLDRWGSIESTFVADGRFLQDHWPHPAWQPLWYCGTRYDYIYPPVLRYGTALLARFYVPVQAYHVFVGLFYCLGIAGVYFVAWTMSRSRAGAWLAAAAAALVSPSFLVTPVVWRSPLRVPWRLWILTAFGEGPHMSALALLPFALAFAWVGLRRNHRTALAMAALFAAVLALTNFYGATGLAIFFPLVAWSLWVTERDHRVWLRAAGVVALAYGLAAFWLTPSYLRITIVNLQYVASRGNATSAVLLALAIVLYVWLSLRYASGRPERAYALFLCGCLLLMGLNVVGYVWFNFRVVGQPHRLIAELDFIMCLAGAEVLRRLWGRRRLAERIAAALVVVFALWMARHYVRHAWAIYPPAADYRERIEYRASGWIATHMPQARTFTAGSIRFWFDAWHDLAETGGGSEQGVLNPHAVEAQWEVLLGPHADLGVAWLRALGADAVVVTTPQSEELYHDYKFPQKFAGTLPVLYNDGRGDVIYGVNRRYRSLARVVDRARMRSVQPLEQTNLDRLLAYDDLVEQGPDAPTTTAWQGTDQMDVHARVGEGQSVLVQITYDPAWHAYAGNKPLRIYPDRGADFILIDAPPGEHDIRLVFETPLENRVGWLLTGLAVLISAALCLPRRTGYSALE